MLTMDYKNYLNKRISKKSILLFSYVYPSLYTKNIYKNVLFFMPIPHIKIVFP